ncbi:hypothetical protein TNCV_1916521 [Trichonephila clavipes]|uniref:Uncharacterized protein n=1 Tax=Trichonephila clavipes TaxID=2585209 RepID=A0A8X6W0Q6_TRICX|nr:hypothetical protein TNCV_1916521 [Trichonephila clavipes]
MAAQRHVYLSVSFVASVVVVCIVINVLSPKYLYMQLRMSINHL